MSPLKKKAKQTPESNSAKEPKAKASAKKVKKVDSALSAPSVKSVQSKPGSAKDNSRKKSVSSSGSKASAKALKGKRIPKPSVPKGGAAKKGAPDRTKPAVRSPKVRSEGNAETSSLQKVREVASKNRKHMEQESNSDSLSFSFDDIVSLLKSKTKSSKPVAESKSQAALPKVKASKATKHSKVKRVITASIEDILGFGGTSVGVSRPIRDEKKVPKQWMSFYKSLMSMRSTLKGSLDERSVQTIGTSARESGELSLNSSDAGTETFDRDLALSMVANDHEALEEIEDAIDRIFDGTYGICQETKKPISKNRLNAVPFTRYSLEGQNHMERSRNRERDSSAGSFATLSDSTMGQED